MRWSFLSTCSIHVTIFSLFVGCQSDQQDIGPTGDCLVKSSLTNGQAIANSYLITYKPDPDLSVAPRARAGVAVRQLLTRHSLNDPDAQVLFSGEKTGFLAHISAAEAEQLKADPAVEFVEPDRTISLCSCVDVTVTSTLTWNVKQTGYGRGDLNAGKTAWVLDTGIDFDHPDLKVDKNRSQSFITGKTADDENGHGTHIAGIIGALNNPIGVTGVASGATLVALRVLDNEGEGKLSALVQAVSYVSQNGKAGDVVNISIGGEGTSPTLERIIKQAADKGILFAIAAGNEGESAEKYTPANINHPNVFTVSAMDQTGKFATFSNYGPTTVDACAYGVRITSTYLNGKYATMSGTSMASPHVAGLLLIRGNHLPTNGFVTGDPDGDADPRAGE
ncbi:S8 family serine peptidase [Larkinella bovis]|uniref:S8 family serine peptidase n=1 Tax=Larkinella bovis TaxID=683041 RepID=A0ABW0I8F4_9BACT